MMNNGKTVIIADDHETLVMYLSILMHRMGFTVHPARNGEEVMHLLETITPDLVITDRKMPIMDGITILKMMKNDPRFASIPVIMATAYYDQKVFDECMKLGAAGLLTKPIRVNTLHKLLQECVTYPNDNQRRNLRCSYGHKVTVEHGNQQQELYAVNLSEGGIYLRTQNPLAIGTEVKIRLEMQAGQFLDSQGTVIYQKNVFNDIYKVDPGMAVKFMELSVQDAEDLKAYITEILTGDLQEEQQEAVIAAKDLQIEPQQEVLSTSKQTELML